jgi:hypothetical protein
MAWEHEQAKQDHKTYQNWKEFFHSVIIPQSGEELKLGLVDECLIYEIQIELRQF